MTKKKHRHIDKSIKMESSHEVNIQTLSRIITLLLLVYVVVRFIILGIILNNGIEDVDTYYFVRHTLYSITWLTLAYFFYTYSFHVDITRGESAGFIQTAQASLIAMGGCIMKFVIVTQHTFPWLNHGMVRNVYVVTECLFWVALITFFYKYRQHCIRNHEMREQYRREHDDNSHA